MPRRRASSPIGTGPSPQRASSLRACSAYGDFVVIDIIALHCDGNGTGQPLRTAAGRHGAHLRARRTPERSRERSSASSLSATPDLNSGLGWWDLVLRKLAHVTIYAVLWLTLMRATGWRRPLMATVVALL